MFLTASVSISVLSPQTRTLVRIYSCHRYLEVSRDKELTPSVKEGVDTLLMYLYRALDNVHEMEKLVSSANSCVVVCFLISYLFFILFLFCSLHVLLALLHSFTKDFSLVSILKYFTSKES